MCKQTLQLLLTQFVFTEYLLYSSDLITEHGLIYLLHLSNRPTYFNRCGTDNFTARRKISNFNFSFFPYKIINTFINDHCLEKVYIWRFSIILYKIATLDNLNKMQSRFFILHNVATSLLCKNYYLCTQYYP